MCRSIAKLEKDICDKLAMFCHVPTSQVAIHTTKLHSADAVQIISVYNVTSVYRVPLLLVQEVCLWGMLSHGSRLPGHCRRVPEPPQAAHPRQHRTAGQGRRACVLGRHGRSVCCVTLIASNDDIICVAASTTCRRQCALHWWASTRAWRMPMPQSLSHSSTRVSRRAASWIFRLSSMPVAMFFTHVHRTVH